MRLLTHSVFAAFLIASLGASVPPPVRQKTATTAANARATVTQVHLNSAAYTVSGGKYGAVWVAVDDGILIPNGANQTREVPVGYFAEVKPESVLLLRAKNTGARIVIVLCKTEHQPLTITAIPLKLPVEDASDRNTTLLIAPLESHFLIQEGRKKDLVSLQGGESKWLTPGIYTFRNAGASPGLLIAVEW